MTIAVPSGTDPELGHAAALAPISTSLTRPRVRAFRLSAGLAGHRVGLVSHNKGLEQKV